MPQQRTTALLLLVALLLVARVVDGSARRSSEGFVSSTQRYATLAGLEILGEGGNAADAAAAVQLALAVVQPQSTGIGGGCL